MTARKIIPPKIERSKTIKKATPPKTKKAIIPKMNSKILPIMPAIKERIDGSLLIKLSAAYINNTIAILTSVKTMMF